MPAYALMPLVRKRLVIHLSGYDPMRPDVFRGRFARELKRFETTWRVSAAAGPAEPFLGEAASRWTASAEGPNWRVEADVILFRWDDLVREAAEKPSLRRLAEACLAFADFVAGGALWGYLRSNWRYAAFFLYPFAVLTGFALVAALTGWAVAATGMAAAVALGIASGAAVFAALLRLAGERLRLPLLLDDWIFARSYVRGGGDPRLAARVDRLAEALVTAVRAGTADEIVVIGHSLGAVWAIEVLDRALERDPALCRGGPPLILVTIGASILKLGLHRAAGRLRAAVARVAAEPALPWADFQALKDVMNFFRTDPLAAMGLPACGKPLIRLVSLRKMLDAAIYRRMRLDFFRLHCQFVSGNDRRAPYDYFMLVLGPVAAAEQVRSEAGIAPWIGADGGLIPPHAAAAAEAVPTRPQAAAR